MVAGLVVVGWSVVGGGNDNAVEMAQAKKKAGDMAKMAGREQNGPSTKHCHV